MRNRPGNRAHSRAAAAESTAACAGPAFGGGLLGGGLFHRKMLIRRYLRHGEAEARRDGRPDSLRRLLLAWSARTASEAGGSVRSGPSPLSWVRSAWDQFLDTWSLATPVNADNRMFASSEAQLSLHRFLRGTIFLFFNKRKWNIYCGRLGVCVYPKMRWVVEHQEKGRDHERCEHSSHERHV